MILCALPLPTCSDGKKTLDRPAQTNASKGINTKANTSTLSYQVCSLLFSTTVGNSFLISTLTFQIEDTAQKKLTWLIKSINLCARVSRVRSQHREN